MGGHNYYLIDNKGKGNCGYYVYAISLMYALRYKHVGSKKEDKDEVDKEAAAENITNGILDEKLNLRKEDSESLKTYLQTSINEKRTFNEKELSDIQIILEPALRKFAAEATIQEYEKNFESSHLFAVAKHEMLKQFKEKVKDNDILTCQFASRSDDFKHAELYKWPAFLKQLETFVNETADALKCLYQNKKPESADVFTKTQIFEELIKDQCKVFFTKERLTAYKSYLANDGQWASEETLLCMHRAITDETEVRSFKDSKTHIDWQQKYPIKFSLAKDQHKVCDLSSSDEEIIMHNHSNTHWTSVIPKHLLSDIEPSKLNNCTPFKLYPPRKGRQSNNNISSLIEQYLKETEQHLKEIGKLNQSLERINEELTKIKSEQNSNTDALKELEKQYNDKNLEKEIMNERFNNYNQFLNELLIIQDAQNQSGLTGAMTLKVLLSVVENIALLALAVLAGVGVGIAVATTGVGIPAGIGLGVATTVVTGSVLLSFFNQSKSKPEENNNLDLMATSTTILRADTI